MAETTKARIPRKGKWRLTAERLRERLHYDPNTGIFTWKTAVAGRFPAGMRAGYVLPCGHRVISVDGFDHRASHLAFLYMTGQWPADQVDHRDVDPGNDAWSNLRQCCEGENRRNVRAYKNNTSGFKGVYSCGSRWRAQISSGRKSIGLGVYGTREEASAAYAVKAKELFGEFARVK